MTEADYLALPDDNRRIELLDGALLMSPSASGAHQRLSSRLWLALERARPQGMEVFEAVSVRLGSGRILVPDWWLFGARRRTSRFSRPRTSRFLAQIDLPTLVAAERPQVEP